MVGHGQLFLWTKVFQSRRSGGRTIWIKSAIAPDWPCHTEIVISFLKNLFSSSITY